VERCNGSGLSALEIACGIPLGTVAAARAVPGGDRPPLAALEAAIAPALERAPCLVSFSGGADSSLVLAVAVRLARRLALAEPVPITWRFGAAPHAEESVWQERVIAELGARDWVRLQADEELDFVGPHARAVLRRHGLRYPPNAHLHGPLLARARGGSLLTGMGGDHVLALGRWRRAAAVLAGARRPTLGDGPALALALAPAPARRLLDPRRAWLASPWLWPAVAQRAARMHAADRASEPMWWRGRVAWQPRRRDLAAMLETLEILAADSGALVVNPLVAPGFLAAVARGGGRRGFPSRAAALHALLGDAVPAAVLERRGKARFGEVFWAAGSRALAREWEGDGVDTALVDRAALARVWGGERFSPRTAMLLQQVWLARRAREDPAQAIPQPPNDGPA
jgi:hypothetical protein